MYSADPHQAYPAAQPSPPQASSPQYEEHALKERISQLEERIAALDSRAKGIEENLRTISEIFQHMRQQFDQFKRLVQRR
ncbi:hypothetical protein JXB02_05955 [Candidatus Woesearchaeota archaeon]|nr:hypothetical protein [Candidatus Woesearchaeota archaeon]